MTEKTYSQKVARVFEIIDYFMLLPAGIGFLVGLAFISVNPLYTVLLYAFLTTGIVLMVGYFKHSRGRLDEKYISALWLTTAAYNLVLFLPCLYRTSRLLQEANFKGYEGNDELASFMFLLAVVFAYLAAIVFSMKAFSFERRKKLI